MGWGYGEEAIIFDSKEGIANMPETIKLANKVKSEVRLQGRLLPAIYAGRGVTSEKCVPNWKHRCVRERERFIVRETETVINEDFTGVKSRERGRGSYRKQL